MLNKKVRDFSLAATGEQTISLAGLRDRKVVLYFYPKDSTPGCTTEAQQFRDLHAKFAKAGTVILGISRDSIRSHENFKGKLGLPFELLSDSEETLCEQFGVIKMKNMYGKQVRGGSWYDTATFNLSAVRLSSPPVNADATLGFRCAADLP